MFSTVENITNPNNLVNYLNPYIKKNPIIWSITFIALAIIGLIALVLLIGSPFTLPIMMLIAHLSLYSMPFAMGACGVKILLEHLFPNIFSDYVSKIRVKSEAILSSFA